MQSDIAAKAAAARGRGLRDLDPSWRVLDDTAETVHLRTRRPREALGALFEVGRRHVFLEGGPTLAAAFLRAGLVDAVVAYLARCSSARPPRPSATWASTRSPTRRCWRSSTRHDRP